MTPELPDDPRLEVLGTWVDFRDPSGEAVLVRRMGHSFRLGDAIGEAGDYIVWHPERGYDVIFAGAFEEGYTGDADLL